MELVIGLLIILFVIVFFSLMEDFLLGDRGKKGQLVEYYTLLKGATEIESIDNSNRDSKFRENRFGRKKYIVLGIIVSLGLFVFVYVLFKSIIMAFFTALFGAVVPKLLRSKDKQKSRLIMNLQFVDALNSITNSMKAGLSMNSSLIKCCDELEKMYARLKYKPMLDEFKKIRNDLNMGSPLEEVLKDFSKRVELEDVEDFVNSIIIVKIKGGNLIEVIENITGAIADKISIKKEIDVLTAGKRMEAKLVTFAPLFVVVMLSFFSPSYMEPMFETTIGHFMVALGISLLILNYFIGQKIVDIKV